VNVKITGSVLSGRGKGSYFTELDWAKRQFVEILGFEPAPGTLNIRLEKMKNRDILQLRRSRTAAIEPPDRSFYRGIVLPTVIDNVVKGAIVVPQVPNYDSHFLEIVAPINLREKLNLKDGDAVTLEF
jgi:riboflavin kinase